MAHEDPRLEALPDRLLLEELAGPARTASLAELLRRHGPMLLEVCRRSFGDGSVAEDAFRATVGALMRKRGPNRREPASSWLHRLACRTALQLKKSESTAEEASPPFDSLGLSIFAVGAWEELRPVLDRELGRLPPIYRAPLVLCCLEGQTIREAARQLQWGRGKVRRRLLKGRDLLRQRLARRGLPFSTGLLSRLLTREAAGKDMPTRLMNSTVEAAVRAAREPASTAFLFRRVAWLVNGALKALAANQWRLAAICLAAVGKMLEI